MKMKKNVSKVSLKAVTCIGILLLGSVLSAGIANAKTNIDRKFIGTWTIVDPPFYQYVGFFHFYPNGNFRSYAIQNLEEWCLLGTWTVENNQVVLRLSYPADKTMVFTSTFFDARTVKFTDNYTSITLSRINRNPNGFIMCMQDQETVRIPGTLKRLSLKEIDHSGSVTISVGSKEVSLSPGESTMFGGIKVSVAGSLYEGKIALFTIQRFINYPEFGCNSKLLETLPHVLEKRRIIKNEEDPIPELLGDFFLQGNRR